MLVLAVLRIFFPNIQARWQNSLFIDDKNDLSFDGQIHIIIVELAKAEKLVQKMTVQQMGAAESWAVFLRYHAEKGKRGLVNEILKMREDIAMAGETALAFSKEELEYFHNMSKLKYELDMQDMRVGAMREGKAQGLAEGLVQGKVEGRVEGRAEGRVEGKVEEKRETAIKLKAIGLSIAQITEVTGLLAEEIEKL